MTKFSVTRLAVTIAVAATIATAVANSKASPPPPTGRPPPAVAERDVFPTAGYVRTAKLLFLQRRLVGGNRPNAVFNAERVISGRRGLPVICVAFSNRPQPTVRDGGADVTLTPTMISERLFGRADGARVQATMTQYYRDVSYRRLEVTGRVLGWYQAPKTDAYYENNVDRNNNGQIDLDDAPLVNGDGAPFGELLTFGLGRADADVDFGVFDNDGPDGVPNSGDDDGKVDTVFFIHPEAGAECNGTAIANIWSHFFQYRFNTAHPDGAYVTKDIRRGRDGQPLLGPDGQPQLIVVSDYTIQPALECEAAHADGIPPPFKIGVYTHEFGHALGLPDLYDRTEPRTGSIAQWCLMSGGSYGGDGKSAELPVHMSAWCKYLLGWSNDQTVSTEGLVPLAPVEDRGTMLRLLVPESGGKEYFLAEFRNPSWQPIDDRINWDRNLPGAGMAVWHIDENVGASSPRWPFAGQGQGQNDDGIEVLTGQTGARFALRRPLVRLVQADGRLDLEARRQADADDLFTPARPFRDDPTLRAGSRGYRGQATGIEIKDFNPDNAQVRVVIGGPVGAPPVVVAAAPPRDEDRRWVARDRIPLKALDPTRIPGELSPVAVAELRVKAANARTARVTTDSTPEAAPAVAGVLTRLRAGSDADLTVQFSPAEGAPGKVERLVGLNLPKGDRLPSDDARAQIDGDIKALIGDGVVLEQDEVGAGPRAGKAPRFVQVVPTNVEVIVNRTSDGKPVTEQIVRRLPVFGADVTFHYSPEGPLKAFTNHTNSDVRVSGLLVETPPQEVKEGVVRALNLPEEALKTLGEPRAGVYFDSGDPGRARPAYQVTVPVGPGHDDIRVYYNPADRTVLAIK